MKLIITALLALVFILTILNKMVSFFRPQRKMDTKWLMGGLAISAFLLIVALAHYFLQRDKSPSGTGVVAALILLAIFADQYRIQRAQNLDK